jgi:two-component system chemotaxis response regulator CheY
MKRILIVDDAATVRLYHRHLLTNLGYTVDEAINGLEALEKALAAPYDLYIVDVNMPKLDGYAFLRDLRVRDIPQGPAVMVSTEAGVQDEDLAFRSGANGYLVKPTHPATLIRLVRLLLGEAEL